MAKMKYALEDGGPNRLEICWKGNWKEFTIRLDGNEIGLIADEEQLRAGQEFALDDGSCLHVQLAGRFGLPRLLRDGRPLPRPGPAPAKRLSYAYKIIFLIGGANLFAGLAGKLSLMPYFTQFGFGLGSILAGVVFVLLGFFVMRRSMIALGIAVGLFAVDTVYSFFIMPKILGGIVVVGLVLRTFVLFSMVQGFGAIRLLKEKDSHKREKNHTLFPQSNKHNSA